ncbi:MAG: hypothetical protein R2733_17650 [Acidimicrobiales bacterium]
MMLLRRHATTIALLGLLVIGMIVLTRDPTGLRDIKTLPVGLYTVERSGEPPIFVWWESFDSHYVEFSDESGSTHHQLTRDSKVISWELGNVIDLSKSDSPLDNPTDEQLAAIGYGTAPRTVDTADQRAVPDGALTPPGLLASDYTLNGTTMTRGDEELVFSGDGIPLSAVLRTAEGRVATTTISFEPGVTAGDVVPGCTALSTIAKSVVAQYPPAGCD